MVDSNTLFDIDKQGHSTNNLANYRITPHTTRTFIHCRTYVKEGVRVINGYINQNIFYSDSIDAWGMVENTLVGSYCLLACHHDDVMMIAILIPWTYQIMFENRLFPYC